MSELREECYKCLNNQSCPGAADYGSIICMTKRKYKMPGNEEDSIYAHKFAIMQKQINEKEKKIKELEEANKQLDLDYVDKNYIPKQKVKEIIYIIIDYKIPRATNNGYYYDYFIKQEYKNDFVRLFNKLLEDK